MKTCTRCCVTKALTEFNRHSRERDGLDYHCKLCMQESNRERYKQRRVAKPKRRYSAFKGFSTGISQLDWARMAMALDTEGCISVLRNTAKRPCSRTPMYSLSVVVFNTNPKLMHWCQSLFGGYVYEKPKKNPKHKISYQWQASSLRARAVLEGCMPYFIMKREQAENALALQALISKYGKGPSPMTAEDVQDRDYHYQKSKELNRRGPAPELVQ